MKHPAIQKVHERSPSGEAAHPNLDVLIANPLWSPGLPLTLGSLIGQTVRPRKVIIVDAGSRSCREDREVCAALRVLNELGSETESVLNPSVFGIGQRQALLERTDAPYALFLDHNVVLEPDLIDRLAAALTLQGCGFIGSYPNQAVDIGTFGEEGDDLQDAEFEPWLGTVAPEVVTPGNPAWRRRRIHTNGVQQLICRMMRITRERPLLYRIASCEGCYLADVSKLRAVGGYVPRTEPPVPWPEDLIAQLRLMARFGGAAIAPSGAWRQGEARDSAPYMEASGEVGWLVDDLRVASTSGGSMPRQKKVDDERIIASRTTSDPNEIREWAQRRGAIPVLILPSRHPPELGCLSFTFDDERPDTVVRPLAWAQWLAIFSERGLQFSYQLGESSGPLNRSFCVHQEPRDEAVL